jgi:hypothetical protein
VIYSSTPDPIQRGQALIDMLADYDAELRCVLRVALAPSSSLWATAVLLLYG